jgi:Arc/MetJ-type ribon-helix-helix transcriptional regulator
MKALQRRTRMISVRLSEEEYSALRRLCFITGARSVSDLTRDAMRKLLKGGDQETALEGEMQAFRLQIERLIEQLRSDISSFRANNGH